MRRTPLKRSGPLPKRRKGKPRRGRIHDKAFLRWLHAQPCSVPECGAWDIEAAHVGERGYGQKCHDREAISLCSRHHRTGRDAQHVLGKFFWSHHGIDKREIIQRLNEQYERESR